MITQDPLQKMMGKTIQWEKKLRSLSLTDDQAWYLSFYTITRNMQITSHIIHESILRPTQKGRDQRWMPYQNPDGSKTWLAVNWSMERSMTSTCCSYRNPTKTDMLRRGLLGGWDETMTKGNNSEVFRNFLWPDKSSIPPQQKPKPLLACSDQMAWVIFCF